MEQKCGNCVWFKDYGENIAENECKFWPIPEASYNFTEPMHVSEYNGQTCPCFKPKEEENERD